MPYRFNADLIVDDSECKSEFEAKRLLIKGLGELFRNYEISSFVFDSRTADTEISSLSESQSIKEKYEAEGIQKGMDFCISHIKNLHDTYDVVYGDWSCCNQILSSLTNIRNEVKQ